jgi:hypothetical protein
MAQQTSKKTGIENYNLLKGLVDCVWSLKETVTQNNWVMLQILQRNGIGAFPI